MSTEIVRDFVEAIERRDLEAALECLDESVYFVTATEGADFSRHEGFGRWWDLQVSSDSELCPLRIEALDNHHVFVELLTGHPESDGHTWVAETLGCVYTVGDETIEAIEMFADAEQARERAGRALRVLRREGLLRVS